MPHRAATARVAGVAATALPAARTYARHASERTLLYALVKAHYPDFAARLAAEDRSLPEYVREEFDEYLRCGVLDHGFLRVVCEQCHAERLLAFSRKKRGFWKRPAMMSQPRPNRSNPTLAPPPAAA